MSDRYTLHNGDCFDVLKTFEDASIDAVVTDPPAGINFMGSNWDVKRGYEPKTKRGAILHDALSKLAEMNYWGDRDFNELGGFAVFITDVFCEVFRVLRPGGHALVWTLPRTSDLTGLGLRAAGFEVRDDVCKFGALFGSGFPKSLDVSKAIDRVQGNERKVVGTVGSDKPKTRDRIALDYGGATGKAKNALKDGFNITTPGSETSAKWEGFGTALKPSREDWLLVRRPLDGTVAANVLSHGTGALNIDGCRIPTDWSTDPTRRGWQGGNLSHEGGAVAFMDHSVRVSQPNQGGRFPTHTILTHHPSCEPCGTKKVKAAQGERRETGKGATPIVTGTRDTGLLIGYADKDGTETVQAFSCAAYCPTCNHGFTAESGSAAICSCGAQAEWVCPVAALDFSTLGRVHSAGHARTADHSSEYDASSYDMSGKRQMNRYPVTGDNPSRFMHTFHYYTKASRAEREKYVTIEPDAPILHIKRRLEASGRVPRPEFKASFDALVEKAMARPRNDHSTLKPIELMKWLVRLIGCQKGSVILDPFMGSGTTGIAAVTEGFKFIGIEQNARFVEIAHQRISKARPGQEVEHYLQGMVPLFGR